MERISTADRFWAKVQKGDGCWTWLAGTQRFGYGAFWVSQERPYIHAHRYAYELFYGPVPSDMHVLHKCDNPPCVNPAHLFLGTAAENMYDRHRKGRYASGAQSWSSTNKDRVARGDRHSSKTKPHCVARGERNGQARLTAEQVRVIRDRLAGGVVTHRALAAEYGVDRTTITAINRGKNWAPNALNAPLRDEEDPT